MTFLKVLIGLTVNEIIEIHDYVQLFFPDNIVLNIFSNYVCEGCSLLDLRGRRVVSVKDLEDIAVIFFDDETSISINVKNGDYEGPEAMVLYINEEPPVVWN